MADQILGRRVQCSKDGCDWEGELGDLERHISSKCLYRKELCPHGCGQVYPRYLQIHLCPQLPLQFQLETVERQFTQTYELLLESLAREKKDKELQQQLAQLKHKEQLAGTIENTDILYPSEILLHIF